MGNAAGRVRPARSAGSVNPRDLTVARNEVLRISRALARLSYETIKLRSLLQDDDARELRKKPSVRKGNALAGWLRWLWIELRHGVGVRTDRHARALIEAELRGRGLPFARSRERYGRAKNLRFGAGKKLAGRRHIGRWRASSSDSLAARRDDRRPTVAPALQTRPHHPSCFHLTGVLS